MMNRVKRREDLEMAIKETERKSWGDLSERAAGGKGKTRGKQFDVAPHLVWARACVCVCVSHCLIMHKRQLKPVEALRWTSKYRL